MNIKLDASVVLALTLSCFALSANAKVKYTPEVTNDWFTVNSIGTLPAVDDEVGGGKWIQVPESGDAWLVESIKVGIDTDLANALVYTNTTAAGPVYRIATTIKVTLSSELPTNNLADAKTAICVCTNGVNSTPYWWALINGSWTNLGVSPAVDTEYEIALDSDTTAGKIRYLATTTPGSGYTILTGDLSGADADGWVANSASSVAITQISFAGATTIASFAGDNYVQGYEYNGTIYDSIAGAASEASSGTGDFVIPVSTGSVTVAAATIPASWISSNGSGDDLAAKVQNLNETGSNGIAYWQSYVLGLTPSDANSKPVVQPEQDASPAGVSFSMGNVDFKSTAGVPVKYRVKAFSDSACTAHVDDGDSALASPGEKATASLPPSNVGVRYYKMEIQFGE